MKIGYVTADWSDMLHPETGHPTMGGSGWYRCGMPSKAMKDHGVESVAVELISVSKDGSIWLHDWDGKVHRNCDIIVFQRWMHEIAEETILNARASGQIIVNDIDDYYWGLHSENAAYKATDPRLHPECNRNHYWNALRASDLITASTPFLADKLTKLNVNIAVVRNSIDLERWEYQDPRSSYPVAGWVGSTTHRSMDLETLTGILGPWCERNQIPFLHGGHWPNAPSAGDLALVPKSLQQLKDIVSILDYPTLFRGIDIGIVPLSMNAFNESKSYIKGLEYAASGVPFIAQATGEYEYLAKECEIGRAVKKKYHWIRELDRLVDPETRLEDARRNRANVEKHSIDNKVHEWIDVYESLV